MLKVILVRPGATDFDEQRRIKGCLDLPLTPAGEQQAERTSRELARESIEALYTAPCQAARQTADILARDRKIRVQVLDSLQNLDLGLWNGKLIDEVKRSQPTIYRLWQDAPEQVCPPEGEMISEARARVVAALKRICRRHREGTIALVVPEPLATIVHTCLRHTPTGDLWKAECDCGRWEWIDVQPAEVALSR